MSSDVPTQYWDAILASGAQGALHLDVPLWRSYCDVLHARLLNRWLAGRRYSSALKTDLFDEAVGAGLAPWLLSHSDEVVGIDIATAVVTCASARHPRLRVRVCDVCDIEAVDGTFDLIISNSTLDHFTTPAAIQRGIQELARVLRPGGDVVVTLDNPSNPIVALRNALPPRLFGGSSVLPYFVGHTLSLRRLRAEVVAAGLEVLHHGYLMHVPRLLYLHLCRTVPQHGRVARWVLQLMLQHERFNWLPTRGLSGHYVAVHARKRAEF